MNGPTWRIDDEDGNPEATGTPPPLLVTGRALRDALARTWRTWMGAMIVGAVLGVMAVLALPHPASASTTLLMVHPDPGESAMTTDVNLLQTRAVASQVLADLDLRESPEALLSTVTVTPVNNQILSLTVSAPDEASAVARATSLVATFLEFRAEQLRSISDGIIEGYEKRVADRQSEVDALTREYDRLSGETNADEVRASDILATRATLTNQITLMQSAIEEASLKTDAAITATHIIDAPRAQPFASRRRMVLFAASGAILGAAMSTGIILFRALTSDRLRQRREVAAALGIPVRIGVGPIPSRGLLERAGAAVSARLSTVAVRLFHQPKHGPPRAGLVRLLYGKRGHLSHRRRQRNLEALVQGLESALPSRLRDGPPPGDNREGSRAGKRSAPTTLGLAAVDRPDTAAVVLRAAGSRMAQRGVRVLLVDLTSTGALATHPGLSELDPAPGGLRVYRPEGDPALSRGPCRVGRRRAPDPVHLGELGAVWREVDLVLVLVEVDPGIDLDIVRTWVNRLVPLVTAGRASLELLSTIAGLASQAGVEMPFALLEGADRSDQTLGQPAPIVDDRVELAAVRSR